MPRYLMLDVFRNWGEGPAKRWAVKNAENGSLHLLPHIFLPNNKSANGCAGNMAVSDFGPIFDAGCLQELGEGPAKRWAVKNAENSSPHLLPHIFLPNKKSANGCAGNMAVSDLGPIFDAGGFQELGEGPAKRWAVKNAENSSPHL